MWLGPSSDAAAATTASDGAHPRPLRRPGGPHSPGWDPSARLCPQAWTMQLVPIPRSDAASPRRCPASAACPGFIRWPLAVDSICRDRDRPCCPRRDPPDPATRSGGLAPPGAAHKCGFRAEQGCSNPQGGPLCGGATVVGHRAPTAGDTGPPTPVGTTGASAWGGGKRAEVRSRRGSPVVSGGGGGRARHLGGGGRPCSAAPADRMDEGGDLPHRSLSRPLLAPGSTGAGVRGRTAGDSAPRGATGGVLCCWSLAATPI